MSTQHLTPAQRAHVASVFPECRTDMARYLAEGAQVAVVLQRAVDDVPPYAISVCADPDFWIDCCDSIEDAMEHAKALGLRPVSQ